MGTRPAVELVVESRIDYVDIVHDLTTELAQLWGFDEDSSLNLSLAVREGVINALMHGNALDPNRRATVGFDLDGARICVSIADEGSGFEPDAGPDPTAPENLLNTTGRGLLLIRHFTDEVEFGVSPSGGTLLKMFKDRPDQEPSVEDSASES